MKQKSLQYNDRAKALALIFSSLLSHSDLFVKDERYGDIKICEVIEKVAPDQPIGCQCFKGIWHITFKSAAAKVNLPNKMSTIDIDNHHIEPFADKLRDFDPVPPEKILIKDLLLYVDDNTIISASCGMFVHDYGIFNILR